MSSHNRIVFSLLFIANSLLFGEVNLVSTHQKTTATEDMFILAGLDREFNEDFVQSALLYENLFAKTNKSEYLQKTIDSYFRGKDFKKVLLLAKEHLETQKNLEEYLCTQYIITSIIEKKTEEISPVIQKLKKYPSGINDALIGDGHYVLKEYEEALKYYKSAFQKLQTPNILLVLTNLIYETLGQKKEAIELLEKYQKEKGCDKNICLKLLRYYQIENNLKGMIATMELMYEEHKKTHQKEDLGKFESMLFELYVQNNEKEKGIEFLVNTGNNDLLLVEIYERNKEYQKALDILEKAYRLTSDETLLGRIAMITFTLAKDKKNVIKEVLNNFEFALQKKSNPQYENFYGYLLIDYDLDIHKGLELVQKAYKANPDNLAYADSVAWGYFKTNQCTLAWKYISDIVEKVGLEDEEIKLHYEEIKACLEGKKEEK